MITAVDTSVLIAIDQDEPLAEAWVECLAAARTDGALVLCHIVAAEFFAVVMNEQDFDATLSDLGIHLATPNRQATLHAGRIFRTYRDHGGPREHLIPDFLIAAHALADCDRLASTDRGFLRRYFPELKLLAPDR